MRAYSRMSTAGIVDATTNTSKGAPGAAGVNFPCSPVKSNAPAGWWMNMPQPSVPTSHWIGTRAPCVCS